MSTLSTIKPTILPTVSNVSTISTVVVAGPVPVSASHVYIRPLFASAIAIILDRQLMKQTNYKSNLAFGAAVGLSIMASSTVASNLPVLNFGSLTNGLPITQRLTEVVLGSSGAYVLNKYALKNIASTHSSPYDTYPSVNTEFMQRVGVVIISDTLASVINEYMNGTVINGFS